MNKSQGIFCLALVLLVGSVQCTEERRTNLLQQLQRVPFEVDTTHIGPFVNRTSSDVYIPPAKVAKKGALLKGVASYTHLPILFWQCGGALSLSGGQASSSQLLLLHAIEAARRSYIFTRQKGHNQETTEKALAFVGCTLAEAQEEFVGLPGFVQSFCERKYGVQELLNIELSHLDIDSDSDSSS